MGEWSEESVKGMYRQMGRQIRHARSATGMTQTDLGRAVGLTRSSIANIEAGRQHAPVHVVVLIAHVLEVDVVALLPRAPVSVDGARVATPVLDLDGQEVNTWDFVTAAVRRARGAAADEA